MPRAPRTHRPLRRSRLPLLAALIGLSATTALLLPGTSSAAALALPQAPVQLPLDIEPMPPYQPQTFCDPTDKPGVSAFARMLTAVYRDTTIVGISRACGTDTSEHYEGRALDWGAYYKNAKQVAEVNAVFAWLFAKDSAGHPNAMLRRLGIMYIIWNKQIWGSWSQKWEPYTCSGETACHQNHVHFSFDWSGAMKKTSFWTGVVTAPMAAPHPELTSTVKQVISVPATRDLTTTSFFLGAGKTYRITVSGTYHYRPVRADVADAECWTEVADPAWHALAPGDTSPKTGGRDLVVNGTASGWRAAVATGGGCNTATHTYTMTLKPTVAAPLTLSINDSKRSDDSGALTVTVQRVG